MAQKKKQKRWYGSAGTSMKDSRFQDKFGKGNSAAGSRGEAILEAELHRFASSKVTGFSSLRLPKSRGDVDLVLLSGSTVLLIDAKMWKAGKYHMKGGKLYNGKELYDGKPSRNMTWAQSQIEEYLGEGYTVIPMIILVDFRKKREDGSTTKGSKPVIVKRGTKFPGGVPVYNQKRGIGAVRGALMKARLRTAGRQDYHDRAVAKLKQLVQEV